MQTPIPTIGLGLLLALGATAGRAQTVAPETAPPATVAATQPSAPLDLSLPAAPAQISAPLDPLQAVSAEARHVVRWITESGDNTRLPFLLIDKANAQVLVFNPAGQLLGAAPALLGMAKGDRMLVSNDTKMAAMPPHVRITPAGRFVSKLAKDSAGKELLVLDAAAALSLHPVVNTPGQRRLERLGSATVEDNRISFGCINVPVPFYKTVVSPAFTGTYGIVYVLPETSQASALFGFKPVDAIAAAAQQGSPASATPADPADPAAQPVAAPAAK